MLTKINRYAVLIVMVVYVAMHLLYGYWRKPELIISSDVTEYYSYLPAAFIYGDITLKFKDNNPKFFSNKIWGHQLDIGNYVPKVTMGIAVLYAPFFMLSHAIAKFTAFEPDGYSQPYAVGLTLASLIYFMSGLVLLKRILRSIFSENTIAIIILLIGLATNVSVYLTKQAAMPHTFSFFFFTAFLYLTVRWHDKTTYMRSLLLGFILGLIALVRPTNSIIILIFLLWNVDSFKAFIDKIKFFRARWKYIILIILVVFIVWIPQLIFWRVVTGNWLFYSYGQEGFYFFSPKFLNVLFGFRKGWLLYTPIMFFAIVGMWFLYKSLKKLFVPVLIFAICNLWVIASWWCWWYGGSYGQRVLIDSLPVMAVPLGALIEYFQKTYKKSIYYIYVFSFLFITHNLFQTHQFFHNAIHWDSMSKAAYCHSLFRLYPDKELFFYIVPPDYDNALANRPEQTVSYSEKARKQYQFLRTIFPDRHCLRLPDNTMQSRLPGRNQTIHQLIENTTGNPFFSRFQTGDGNHFIQGANLPAEHIYRLNPLCIAAGYFIKPFDTIPRHSAGIVLAFHDRATQKAVYYHFEPCDLEQLHIGKWNFRYVIVQLPPRKKCLHTDFACYFWNIDGRAHAMVQDVSAFAILADIRK